MASSKERLRWERMWSDAMKRMERQKNSLTRMVMINTEAAAALLEIAGLDPQDKEGFNKAQDRARYALDRIDAVAAANPTGEEESLVEGEPTKEDQDDRAR